MNLLILGANPTRLEVTLALRQTQLHSSEQAWAEGATDRILGRFASNRARNFHGSSVTDGMNLKLPYVEIGGQKFTFGGHEMVELISQ